MPPIPKYAPPNPKVLKLFHSPKMIGVDRFCQIVSWFNHGQNIRQCVLKLRRPASSKEYIGFSATGVDVAAIIVYAAKMGFVQPELLPNYLPVSVRRKPSRSSSQSIVLAKELTLEQYYNTISLYRTGYSGKNIASFAIAWPGAVGNPVIGSIDPRLVAAATEQLSTRIIRDTSENAIRSQCFTFDELLEHNGHIKPRKYLRLYPLPQDELTEEMRHDSEEIMVAIAAKKYPKMVSASIQCRDYISKLRDAGFESNGTDYPGFVQATRSVSTVDYAAFLEGYRQEQYTGFQKVLAANSEYTKSKKKELVEAARKPKDEIDRLHAELETSAYTPLEGIRREFAGKDADTEIKEIEKLIDSVSVSASTDSASTEQAVLAKPIPVKKEKVQCTPSPGPVMNTGLKLLNALRPKPEPEEKVPQPPVKKVSEPVSEPVTDTPPASVMDILDGF